MAAQLPYPAVMGEFVGLLNGLQITHEDRLLLESLMHFGTPPTAANNSSVACQRTTALQSTVATSGRTDRPRSCNILQRRRQTSHTDMEARSSQRKLHRRDRHRASREMTGNDHDLFRASTSPSSRSEIDHEAFAISWQSMDFPLLSEKMGSKHSSSTAYDGEFARSASPGSSILSSYSSPTESMTEPLECSHDFIKIPWSDDDTCCTRDSGLKRVA